MRTLIRFLGKLYPPQWRRRYGLEFDALLDDSRPDAKTAINVFSGAISMQIRTWNLGAILAAGGLAGVLIGVAIGFTVPKRYSSTSVLKFSSAEPMPATLNHVEVIVRDVASRDALTQIVNSLGLYPNERGRMPLEDVIEKMRKDIRFKPVGSDGFAIEFEYSDPALAQKVTNRLAARFVEGNLRGSIVARDGGTVSRSSMLLQVLSIASLPGRPVFPNRTSFALVGLAGGMVLGATLVLFRRAHIHRA